MIILGKRGTAVSNIVVLAGSVRKGGNTELLVQAFVDGAKKNNNVEVISVADYNVHPCIECNTCFDREGHECFQKDDMTKVYEKLKMADVLVIASPVYFYGVSAQLKALIDRLHGIYGYVRNPVYSAAFFVSIGTVCMTNRLILFVAVGIICWSYMSLLLVVTEEKWLRDLYGKQYEDYCNRVNRCIPWFRNKVL